MSRERGDGKKNFVFHTECFLRYFVLMFLRIFSLKSYTHLHLNKFRHVGQLSGWHLSNLKDLCSSLPKPQSQSRKINENFRPDPNPVLIPEKKEKKTRFHFVGTNEQILLFSPHWVSLFSNGAPTINIPEWPTTTTMANESELSHWLIFIVTKFHPDRESRVFRRQSRPNSTATTHRIPRTYFSR